MQLDLPDDSGPGGTRANRNATTLIDFHRLDGSLLYCNFVRAAPGDAGFAFLGIIFDDARIACVRPQLVP